MPEFRTTRHVAHSPEKMFDLVADVERYPEFVPFCERLTVRKRHKGEGREIVVADMTIGYRLIRETFTSKVTFERDPLVIVSENVDGPFRTMTNRWSFRPAADGGCDVRFEIAYEFRSRTLAILMGAMFDRAFRMFVHAFETRADRIFGKSSPG
jgi:coenzyme Q-binding protein COQ10